MPVPNPQQSADVPSEPMHHGAQSPVVVGIGASAGALEALERLFASLPANSGLVFVVVQHLERHHPSVLSDLLGKHTRMSVQQAQDGARALPDHVYIIPPNSELRLERGVLRVARSAEVGLRTPIDTFLRSLAHDQGDHAIGVILSGAGSDGTAGLRAIKEAGGLTLAQTPETAKYDSMPLSAITAGLVDFVLPVEDMPERISRHARHVLAVQRELGRAIDEQVMEQLDAICELLARHTGHDFRRYKPGTLRRRIRRRIELNQVATAADYVRLLESDASEVERLHRDLLIGVTQFFRDPEVFDRLAAEVIPTIVRRADGAPVRIWVPGCASGEEAYTLAILLREEMDRRGGAVPAQVFATDIDGELLAKARLGHYSGRATEQVSPERLERFFLPQPDGYQVSKTLREMCTFSEHSLIRDPPFSSLDLISCRNVLIYLGPDLQKNLVPLFHYALRPGGFLLLGPSEGIAAHAELFVPVDVPCRLYRRNDVVVRPPLVFPFPGGATQRRPPARAQQIVENVAPQVFSQAFERMVLEEYAPPSAVINHDGDILYLAGRAGRYLQVGAGVPSNNLFDVAQGTLRVELRAALSKAAAGQRRVVRRDLALELDGASERVRITVRPLPGVQPDCGLYAVILQPTSPVEGEDDHEEEEGASLSDRSVIEQLENELRTTKATLQFAMQDLESANEELRSTNEELTSTNEELQSANEELQTSKEELQAANDELRTKVLELDSANSDLQYHFHGTRIITVFLDRDMRINRCTPAASKLFNVLESDLGRPFRDLAPRFVEEDVMEDIATVLRTETPIERQVHRKEDESWYLVRILPYRAQSGVVIGIGVTFVDVTELQRAEEAERRYGRLLRLSPDAISVWRLDDGVQTWNAGAEELYGYPSDEVIGANPRELLAAELPCAWAEIQARLQASGRWEGEVSVRARDGRRVTVSTRMALMRGEDGTERVLQSDRDISDRKAAEVERERLIESLREAERRRAEFLAVLSHELRNPLAPMRNSLYVLERATSGGEQSERAKAILERQLGHLTRLVDDLLDITRISGGKLKVRRARLELRELVRQTLEDHRSELAHAGLALEVSTADEPIWVDGDAARLAQVFGNLLDNATKFATQGGHVWVVVEEDREGRKAIVRVRDDGVGIDEGLLARLFEPFVQADRSLDRSRGGLGLGLALARSLVEQHGGELRASSEGAGRGAEFTVELPLAEPRSDDQGAPARLVAGRSRRILIVEDNMDAAQSLRELLELSAHVVAVAHDGLEGLRKVHAFRPEVVLCDIGLPIMDGYQVATAIHSDERLRGTHLVALTGYAMPYDLERAREAGFEAHLAKPLDLDQLERILERLA